MALRIGTCRLDGAAVASNTYAQRVGSVTLYSMMSVRRGRGLMIALLVGAVAAVWWLWDLYRTPNRADLAAYWQLVVAVPSLVIAVVALVKGSGAEQARGQDVRSELDRLADRLADAVEQQWTQAAMARRLLQPEPIAVRWTQPTKAVAGSAAAATASTRFPPLPKMASTRPEQLRAGGLRDLHTVYGGLGSGRLVIVGAPGAGKSGAAVLLVLAALRHRHAVTETDRAKVPVPVLFTLHDWDPSIQPVGDWLIGQLRQTYDGLFTGKRGAGKVGQLIDAGKITVILDGLDEITKQLRPVALRALNDQTTFRLIVLSRSAEIAGATKQAILDEAVAIDLQDVDPATAADYLTQIQLDPPSDRWRELTELVRTAPDSALARALNNPLTLTLVRDTYRTGDTIGELLDFCATADPDLSREDIEDHLLDRLLPQAYIPRPGQPPPRYSLPIAQCTLRLIAARMSQDNIRDLAWWRIPTWTSLSLRALTISVAAGLVVWLGLEIMPWDAYSILTFVVTPGLGGMLGTWLVSRSIGHTAPTRWRFMFSHRSLLFIVGFVLGSFLAYRGLRPSTLRLLGTTTVVLLFLLIVIALMIWLLIWLTIWILSFLIRRGRRVITLTRLHAIHRHPFMVFMVGLGFGLVLLPAIGGYWANGAMLGASLDLLGLLGLGIGLWLGLGRVGRGSVTPLTPYLSWSQYRAPVLGIWFGLGLLAGRFLLRNGWGEIIGLDPGLHHRLLIRSVGLALGFLAGFMLGLVYPETWTTSLACVQLAIRHHTPVRLMRFLDDARERNILRTVGPVYQFRHSRLQDRLAALHGPLQSHRRCPAPVEQSVSEPLDVVHRRLPD
jgi:hypothetical protein